MKNRKKLLYSILTFILLFVLFPDRPYAAPEHPVIALSGVPAYGEVRNVEGLIFMENGGDFTASDYRMTLYLQIYDGGPFWVKPSYDTPYVDINADGTFSVPYVTGGVDEQAVFLHLMLIPSSFTPGSSFEAAKKAALDHVLVSRTREGAVSVIPENRVFLPGAAASAVTGDLPVSAEKLAVNVGKKIIVSETGWPTKGEPVGKAEAGEQEAHDYFTAVRAWSLAQGIPVLWFEAADEPWKAAAEGEAGAHWGILSTAFTVKDCYNNTDFFQGAR